MKEGDVLIHILQEEATNFCEDGNEGRGRAPSSSLTLFSALARSSFPFAAMSGKRHTGIMANCGRQRGGGAKIVRSKEGRRETLLWCGGIIFVEGDPRTS